MNPRTEAMAFRIWAYATAREWDCTHGEIAGALGLPLAPVRGVIAIKGWNQRLRCSTQHSTDFTASAGMVVGFDGPTTLARGDLDALRPAAVLQ